LGLFSSLAMESTMAGYRETLNLPRTDFPMKADLVHREPERLRWWGERDLYGALRRRRAGAPVYLLHDGPPYSNGHLHMGTAANKIWKDAAVRQASLMGLDAPYVPGWDNHGMPIEVQVSKEFRHKGVQPDPITLRRRCREFAGEWVRIQRAEFERLGVWGAWDDPYLTMDPRFEAEILRTFARLAARGFIQRGQRSIHWCPTDRTALAVAEIEYQDDVSPSIYVPFPLRGDPRGALRRFGDVSALAWTTTPWTLPANLGLMVDPAAEYVVVEAGGARHLVARPRLEAVASAVGWSAPAVIGAMRGEDLLDAVFEGPWGNDSRVVDGRPCVSMEDGTGLVHTAPGHGQEDFEVGRRAGLGILCPVDEAGRFTAGAEPFVGRSVLEVNGDILEWLRGRGRLLAASTLTHAYPHCWRCHNPVIFRATWQWFMIIDHDRHRDRALEAIESAVRWDPESSRNRIRESVRGRPDWCLSRQRAWGVGIPAVYCGACDAALLDAGVMERAAALTATHGSDAWYEFAIERFLPDGFACPRCGARGPFRKETDILDVWFDSGSTHRAIQVTHPSLEPAWRRALDGGGRVVYFEGPDQHRGWFNSSLMVGVGCNDRAPYTDVATHGWVLDGEGRAMHKSIGNVISPEDVVRLHGAEIVRWWALSTDWRNDVRVGDRQLREMAARHAGRPVDHAAHPGDEILQRVADSYRKVRNTFRFLLGNLSDFRPADRVPDQRLTRVDRAFARHLRARVEDMREAWESLQFHRALAGLLDLCTVDLSSVFLDFSKDRLYTLAPDDPARRSAQTVAWEALHDLAIAASPALVFTAEEVWQRHPGLTGECPSVHLADWPRSDVEARGEEAWALLQEVRDAVNAAIEPLRASRVMSETKEAEVRLRAPAAALGRLRPFEDELADLLMVSSVTLAEGPGGDAGAWTVEATRTAHPRCDRCWNHRADVAAGGPTPGICGRCAAVLRARGGAPRARGRPASGRAGKLELARVAVLEIEHQLAERGGLPLQRGRVGVDLEHLEIRARPPHPVVVRPVEPFDVVDPDALLARAAAAPDALHERLGAGAQVQDHVRLAQVAHQDVEQRGVVEVVHLGHRALLVQGAREDLGVLVDGAVLDERDRAAADLDLRLEALAQEVDLEVEAPAGHVGVEHVQVGILDDRLEVGAPAELLAQARGELGLAHADVAGDRQEVTQRLGHRAPSSSSASSPGAGAPGCRNCAASRPCRRRRSWNVGRLTWMSRAARVMLPALRVSASTSRRRSASSRASWSERGASSGASGASSRSSGRIEESCARMTARCTRFSSSRTLPGQGCACSARSADCVKPRRRRLW
jgi:isoleucyl-tRNA synthetase